MVPQNGPLAALLDVAENPFGEFQTPQRLDAIESRTGIWALHPMLTEIRQTAAWHDVSAWGLLAGLLARTAGRIPPHVVLVDKNGNPGATVHTGGALDMPVMLIGVTGDGKSTITGILDEAAPAHGTVITGGTGQGIVKAFASTHTVTRDDAGKPLADPYDVRKWATRSVSQETDEFDFMRQEFARAGSQTLSLLRSLTMGKRAGMQNGDKTRTVMLPPHAYRFAAIYVTQPETLDTLMALYKYGDPQRMLYAPVKEYRPVPRPAVAPPALTAAHHPALGTRLAAVGGLPAAMIVGNGWSDYPDTENVSDMPYVHAPVWVRWSPRMHGDVPAMRAALASVRTAPYRKAGTTDPDERGRITAVTVRSHLVLMTIKTAALVTVALGLTTPHDTPQDVYVTDLAWAVAQAIVEVSMGELAGCFEEAKDAAMQEEMAIGTGQGKRNKIAKDAMVEAHLDGVADALSPALSALVRLRVDDPAAAHTVRTVCQTAGRGLPATEARDALESLTTASADFGGIVAVERLGKLYRATDDIMRAPTTGAYLDSVRPGWDRAPYVPAVDPASAFAAVVAGAGAVA